MNYNKKSIEDSLDSRTVTYKTYKKNMKIFVTTTALATILACSLLGNTIEKMTDKIEKHSNEKSISNSVVTMMSPDKSTWNILNLYKYTVDSEGHFAYNFDKLSEDLIKIQPHYFDVVLFNIYSNMQYRSSNIDTLFNRIHYNLELKKEEYPELYYKMHEVKTFEDYLKKNKFINEDGSISKEKYEIYGHGLNEIYKEVLENESKGMKM